MHPNAQTIQSFYNSFQNFDLESMKKCYHPNIHFSDPVFPSLNGKETVAMWSMLIENLKKNIDDWRCKVSNIQASESEGSCRWEAYYIFSGRRVHNIIDARFQFTDGLFIRHVDSFSFYRWARMAFGWRGILLGWTPFFKTKVQSTVKDSLAKYIKRDKQEEKEV